MTLSKDAYHATKLLYIYFWVHSPVTVSVSLDVKTTEFYLHLQSLHQNQPAAFQYRTKALGPPRYF